ncbi:hypothetical protein AVEN_98907-1 [Araneus ventricosus]|uniref:Reverse transcriptase Ty1/copia-type domain-containing protein n=1 Tax=Araneus ventricosus TaxID=182803 RepID=A0A4Y2FZE1_ARAVE|nr:hypothetical protein AVEN_98907-1 [Araneus ventricosus]
MIPAPSLLILVRLQRTITNGGIIHATVKRNLRTRKLSLKLNVPKAISVAITKPLSVKVKDNPLLAAWFSAENKARFVARCLSQKPVRDFGETFAPAARQGSIRIMAALSAKLGSEIHQFDVTTAYLNGPLDGRKME